MGGAGWEGKPGKWEDLLSLVQTAVARGRQGCWAQRCHSITEDWFFTPLPAQTWSWFIHVGLCLFHRPTWILKLRVASIYGLLIVKETWDDRLTMAMALDAVWLRVKNVCRQNGLLIMSVLAVVIGCLLGFFLRTRRLTEQVSLSPPPDPLWRHAARNLVCPVSHFRYIHFPVQAPNITFSKNSKQLPEMFVVFVTLLLHFLKPCYQDDLI